MAAKKRKKSAVVGAFLRRLAVVGAICVTLLITFGEFHWVADLLSHFRLQFAIVLVAVLVTTFAMRRFVAAGLALLCLLPQLWALSWHFLPIGKDRRAAQGPTLEVMAFNVLTSNNRYQEVLDFVEKSSPDILFLQETNQRWKDELASLDSIYPYKRESLREDNFGMLFYSNLPIEDLQIYRDAVIRVPLLSATLKWEGEPLQLIGIHPLPPISRETAAARAATFAKVQELQDNDIPTILVGDFNCSSYSPHFQTVRGELRDTARGRGLHASWHRLHPVFAIPIDHILYGEELVCKSRQTGPKLGSDHSVVKATFQRFRED